MPRRKPLTLYHYTSHSGYDSILRDGYVRGSSGQGARHGDGVYLTSLNPSHHDLRDIVKNNIDGDPRQWTAKKGTDKVKVALQFEIPKGKVEKAGLKHHRDVWVYDEESELWLEHYFTDVVYEWGPYGYEIMQRYPNTTYHRPVYADTVHHSNNYTYGYFLERPRTNGELRGQWSPQDTSFSPFYPGATYRTPWHGTYHQHANSWDVNTLPRWHANPNSCAAIWSF